MMLTVSVITNSETASSARERCAMPVESVNADSTTTVFPMFNNDPTKMNRQVTLQTTLPVNVTYLTAVADEDGTMHFFDDIYGYDKQLDQALAKGRPYKKDPVKINPHLTPGETY